MRRQIDRFERWCEESGGELKEIEDAHRLDTMRCSFHEENPQWNMRSGEVDVDDVEYVEIRGDSQVNIKADGDILEVERQAWTRVDEDQWDDYEGDNPEEHDYELDKNGIQSLHGVWNMLDHGRDRQEWRTTHETHDPEGARTTRLSLKILGDEQKIDEKTSRREQFIEESRHQSVEEAINAGASLGDVKYRLYGLSPEQAERWLDENGYTEDLDGSARDNESSGRDHTPVPCPENGQQIAEVESDRGDWEGDIRDVDCREDQTWVEIESRGERVRVVGDPEGRRPGEISVSGFEIGEPRDVEYFEA